MKILYLFCLMGILIFPAYAEDEMPLAGETAEILPDAAPAESSVADNAARAADAAPEAADKVDLLSATAAVVEENPVQNEEPLPEDFLKNLVSCTQSVATRIVRDLSENFEIIGPKGDKCYVKLTVFDLYIPPEQIPMIKTYEDLERLCKNPEIATLKYQDNYHFAGLISELNLCSTYQSMHHNGRSSTEYKSINATVLTDMTAISKEDACEITLVNEITADNKFMNYNVVCTVPADQIASLLEPYRDLIDLYGAKEITNDDGSISSRTAISNEKTYRADAKIMYELQMRGYCRLQEDKQ